MSELKRRRVASQDGDLSWPLRHAARLFADRDAVVAGGVTRSYGELVGLAQC
jgi:hypothetical protein